VHRRTATPRRTMAVHTRATTSTIDRHPVRRQMAGKGRARVEPSKAAVGTSWGIAEPRSRQMLDALGVAAYTTDRDGHLTFYNDAAAEFWGRAPELGELWCGSYRLFHPDGTPMPHDECPMAIALREGRELRG